MYIYLHTPLSRHWDNIISRCFSLLHQLVSVVIIGVLAFSIIGINRITEAKAPLDSPFVSYNPFLLGFPCIRVVLIIGEPFEAHFNACLQCLAKDTMKRPCWRAKTLNDMERRDIRSAWHLDSWPVRHIKSSATTSPIVPVSVICLAASRRTYLCVSSSAYSCLSERAKECKQAKLGLSYEILTAMPRDMPTFCIDAVREHPEHSALTLLYVILGGGQCFPHCLNVSQQNLGWRRRILAFFHFLIFFVRWA